MFKFHKVILPLLLILFAFSERSDAFRVKDLASLRGMRGNSLIGFSIVIGLNGTGDTEGSLLARKPLKNALERMGITMGFDEMKGRSVAAVMVTATLPPASKQGRKIDVYVSSIGDAISLQGGVLVLTPLRGSDRQVYALAQGLVIGIPKGLELPDGLELTGNQKLTTDPYRNFVPTVGRIVGGANIEKEIDMELNNRTRVYLQLHEPDFTTAFRLAKVINRNLGDGTAKASDAGSVEVSVPQTYLGQTVELISRVENLEIQPATAAKVVINERTGTVVMGTDVKIMPIAISHGDLNIVVKESLPSITGELDTQDGALQEFVETNNILLLKGGSDIKEIVEGLNKIGITNKQLIEVLKTIKDSGAMKADLIIR